MYISYRADYTYILYKTWKFDLVLGLNTILKKKKKNFCRSGKRNTKPWFATF